MSEEGKTGANKSTEETDRWIEVDQCEPEEMETVLVMTYMGHVTIGGMYEGKWEVRFAPWEWGEDPEEIEVIAWRPLPPSDADMVLQRWSLEEP